MLEDLFVYAKSDQDEPYVVVDLSQSHGARVVISALPTVYGYAAPLRQVLLNLVNNALKFHYPDVTPVVELTAHLDGDQVLIEVSDNSIGIPADQLEHVFGLFNRAHEGENFSDSGVGLAFCKRVAIAHGGMLDVTSTLGEVTTFTPRLPAEVVVNMPTYLVIQAA